MTIHSLFIINKSGGLILYRDFSGQSNLVGNDTLHLASTFHGLYAIAEQVYI